MHLHYLYFILHKIYLTLRNFEKKKHNINHLLGLSIWLSQLPLTTKRFLNPSLTRADFSRPTSTLAVTREVFQSQTLNHKTYNSCKPMQIISN